MLRIFDLSGCPIALGGRYEADTSATEDTEDEIRRSLWRMERGTANASGLDGLIDRRLEHTSNRQAPADEVMAMTTEYRRQYMGWNVKHCAIAGITAQAEHAATHG